MKINMNEIKKWKIIGLTAIGVVTFWTFIVPIICAFLIWDIMEK
ncbi:MAG: hypothetical protein AABY22_33745 [Nanoarchaeota archaeon]